MNLTQITNLGGDLEKLTCLVVVTFNDGSTGTGTGFLIDTGVAEAGQI